MRTFESRAIENIATAPATGGDRRWATASAVAIVVLFVMSIPFSRMPIAAVPAFVPSVVGAAVVALVLTAVLLYVQYRIERDLKLALLAIAYAFAALTQTLYVLTFPGIFSATGLLGAGLQTASWFYIASHVGFGLFLIAEGFAARRGWRLSRNGVRVLALGTLFVIAGFAIMVTLGHDLVPGANDANAFTPLWTRVIAPLVAAEMLLAVVIVANGLQTVTQVWLGIVLLARFVAIVTGAELSSGRYSFGWYAARVEEVVAAVVVLAIFLAKINDLMLRLAARSRSTAEALEVGEARYASLANVVPQLIWTTNASGDFEYVNDRWVAYTGLDLNASREAGLRTALDPDQEPAVRERWRQSLRSGEPFAAECRLRQGATGRYRWFLVNAVPVRGRRDEAVAWIGTCTDVDAQKRLEEREAFLARAGERLGASLDVTATVAAMKNLLIPRLAERTWVALLDDDGRYVLTGLGSTDLGDELDARRWIGAPIQPALHDS
ncbi:MAG TPA: MASE4 domain-containing protein, partial [Candidatus Elarobacter sp.]